MASIASSRAAAYVGRHPNSAASARWAKTSQPSDGSTGVVTVRAPLTHPADATSHILTVKRVDSALDRDDSTKDTDKETEQAFQLERSKTDEPPSSKLCKASRNMSGLFRQTDLGTEWRSRASQGSYGQVTEDPADPENVKLSRLLSRYNIREQVDAYNAELIQTMGPYRMDPFFKPSLAPVESDEAQLSDHSDSDDEDQGFVMKRAKTH